MEPRKSISPPRLSWRTLPILLVIIGCARADDVRWERIDLWATKPRIEDHGKKGSRGRTFHKHLAHLGRAGKPSAGNRRRRVPPNGGQIRALEQRFGSSLGWSIDLGDESYFSFIPLGSSDPSVSGTYRVSVRDEGGDIRELYRLTPEYVSPHAPATVEVDLDDYSGS